MIKEQLIISVFQYNIIWENSLANIRLISNWLYRSEIKPDIIVLPEMFTTGFTMNVSQQAENIEGKSILLLQNLATENDVAICGSIIICDEQKYYNRFIFIEPSGKKYFYNKKHLFKMGDEDKFFERGNNKLVFEYKGWRICPMICYDLRFPVWARNRNEYDILIYCANWPANRKNVWDILLKARAIENQAYVIGANRVGTDDNHISYSGNSQLIDPLGNILASTEDYFEESIQAKLSYSELISLRESFNVLGDADKFILTD